jgi:hypothetical protein
VQSDDNARLAEFASPVAGCQPSGLYDQQYDWRDWQTIDATYSIHCAGAPAHTTGAVTLQWTGWQEGYGTMRLIQP